MDGDRAPLAELAALAREFDAWLMVDDAHDLDFARAASAGVPLRIGTLSKALGAYGGYLCASQPVIDLDPQPRPHADLFHRPAAGDRRRRHRRPRPDRARAGPAGAAARQGAAPSPAPPACRRRKAPIVPVVIGEAAAALAASQLLEAEGFLAVAIRPPTVPEGTARLRLSFSAAHPDAEIARFAEIVRTRILRNA